jgi:hypothetical protein
VCIIRSGAIMALTSQAYQFQLGGSDPADQILDKVGDVVPELQIGGADVLIGVWKPPQGLKTKGGVFLPDTTRAEYDYQGVTGLILKMGPYCYRSPKTEKWFVDKDNEADPPQVGEWVMFSFNQGVSFVMRDQMCKLINDQHVLMRLPRPDLVA